VLISGKDGEATAAVPVVNLHRNPCVVELAHEQQGGAGLLSAQGGELVVF
jgi:hypothetical protein